MVGRSNNIYGTAILRVDDDLFRHLLRTALTVLDISQIGSACSGSAAIDYILGAPLWPADCRCSNASHERY